MTGFARHVLRRLIMARPKRHNADYFSHDAGMRNDPKVKALRNKFGNDGYAVWCMMLEVLTASDYFTRSIDEIEIEILSADFGIDSDLFTEILSYMVRIRLLQTGDNCEYLSQKLTDRLQPVTDKRRNSANKGVTVTESTQSKVKESKVKEIKKSTKRFTPPELFEVKAYFCEKGYTEQSAIKAFNYYDVAAWKDSRGSQIKNWKQKMQGVWFKAENESTTKSIPISEVFKGGF